MRSHCNTTCALSFLRWSLRVPATGEYVSGSQPLIAVHDVAVIHSLGLARQEFTPAGRGFDTSVGCTSFHLAESVCLCLPVLNALLPSHCLCASASDLSGSERHFTHMKGAEACKTGPNNCTGTCAFDFWHTAAPATGFDGEYSAEVYGSETVRIIDEVRNATFCAIYI